MELSLSISLVIQVEKVIGPSVTKLCIVMRLLTNSSSVSILISSSAEIMFGLVMVTINAVSTQYL